MRVFDSRENKEKVNFNKLIIRVFDGRENKEKEQESLVMFVHDDVT